MSFKKETEKNCVITSEKLDTNYCQVHDWKKNCAHFYHPSPGGAKNIAIEHQFFCSNIIKTNELKVYISLQENKLVCFTNRIHFSYTIWLMISEKSIIVYTFLPYGEWCTDVPKVSINKA